MGCHLVCKDVAVQAAGLDLFVKGGREREEGE